MITSFPSLQSVTVEVTDEFLEFIEEGALAVEVWGHRRSGFDLHVPGSEEGEGKRLKTFPERWAPIGGIRLLINLPASYITMWLCRNICLGILLTPPP